MIRKHPFDELLGNRNYLRECLVEDGMNEYFLLRTCCEDTFKQQREISDHLETLSRLLTYMLFDIRNFIVNTSINIMANKYEFDRSEIGVVYVQSATTHGVCY